MITVNILISEVVIPVRKKQIIIFLPYSTIDICALNRYFVYVVADL